MTHINIGLKRGLQLVRLLLLAVALLIAAGGSVAVMPFESLREMSEVDVGALHLYLKSPQR